MTYKDPKVVAVAAVLKKRLAGMADKAAILKAVELKALYAEIPSLPAGKRAKFGQEINALRQELEGLVADHTDTAAQLTPIDVTAPFDVNTPVERRPELLPAENGSQHPLMAEIKLMSDIFYRMGFIIAESRELDDEYHMFTSLNFPEGHPARDDYDTFMTVETDKNGNPFVAPAHTSTMQNRLLKKYKGNLEQGRPIAILVPDRVFRNEDLDARHEHTFYQHEGIYVDKGMHAGNLMATLKTFLSEYYHADIDIKTQPFYFPFTEPSFEFALSCPFCKKAGCNICSYSGWIELLGCGMIHPNVLRMAGIDPNVYTGFAWGGGVDRLVMMKYGIEDVRHFHSGKLEFLRQFS
ncbi:MAG TPA: phenylalanine--tRNA ligase subunit alpha [Candidatus Saccharimonadales bacterium]|nr:phenylalanine--tRNA ligase subunit alpha [Candidatus Saccharimonadales bacterium]